MIIDNVKVYTEEKTFVKGGIMLDGDKIQRVYTEEEKPQFGEKEVLDGEGAYAIPGLIDLHFHGCKGDDFCDGNEEAIERIAQYEASIGVTAIAPATMTLPVEELKQILSVAAKYKKSGTSPKAADLVGINMEGPFISKVKKGAQDERNIIPCNVEIAEQFLEASDGLVKFIGIAPEDNEDYLEFIEEMKGKVNISLAHTNADYDTAKKAFDAGANHAVHLYNAMPAFNHRAPGVVGAVYDGKHVMAEIICDGIHIHPAMVRATFEMFTDKRIVLISDSMMATGMDDGQYELGGQPVTVVGNLATLTEGGAIAGSATNLMDCMRTAVKKMNIPLESAVRCATLNPAKSIGIDDKYGSLEEGKYANAVVLDKDLNIVSIIQKGQVK